MPYPPLTTVRVPSRATQVVGLEPAERVAPVVRRRPLRAVPEVPAVPEVEAVEGAARADRCSTRERAFHRSSKRWNRFARGLDRTATS